MDNTLVPTVAIFKCINCNSVIEIDIKDSIITTPSKNCCEGRYTLKCK